jgi:GNAT superfamily N-acetyltransferase
VSDSYYIFECPREKLDPYIALIFSKWLRSLKYDNDYFRLIDDKAYYAAYHRYIQSILDRRDCVVSAAVLSSDADVVLGFSVAERDILHYVHVHRDNRRLGIGRRLLPAGICTISHLTRTGLAIWASRYPTWKFNPFS